MTTEYTITLREDQADFLYQYFTRLTTPHTLEEYQELCTTILDQIDAERESRASIEKAMQELKP